MSHIKGDVILIAHLPGVVIPEPVIPFMTSHTELQQLPYDEYQALTGGAHDRKSEYEMGRPVALVSVVETDLVPQQTLSGSRFLEMKSPAHRTDLLATLPNGDAVAWALDMIYGAWVSLSLARPVSGFIQPRLSSFFLVPDGPKQFEWRENTFDGIQVQGDADHEYFVASKLTEAPLTQVDIQHANRIAHLIRPIQKTPELAGALRTFLDAQDAALGRVEQATLCTIALEELLLRGQTTGLQKAFVAASSALVPKSGTVSKRALGDLYGLRSDVLHGRSGNVAAASPETLALAPALLASAILSLGRAVSEGSTFSSLLNEGTEALSRIVQKGSWQAEEQFRVDNRMSGHRSSIATQMGTTMGAPEGKAIAWSPLIGLDCPEGVFTIGKTAPVALSALSFVKLEELEDGYIREDFLRRTSAAIQAGQIPDTGRALLLVPDAKNNNTGIRARAPHDYPSVRATVIALRALGFGNFLDPVLLGEYYFEGKLRLRLPSVYRQTLLTKWLDEVDQPDPVVLSEAGALADTVLQIAQDHPGIDRQLTLLREAFFHPIVSNPVRARLCFAFTDAVVGRISGSDIGAQVARLAQEIAPGSTGRWFAKDARGLRNRLAHTGASEVPENDLNQLLAFSQYLALQLLRYVSSAGQDISAKGFQTALKERM
ncbi:hypothetical protein [uncultured Ruegeria sp.]|uniref:hypothetical protein n=1 Tax=uncultured Ruegeria sp. TaxID=259304 RepID=UPI002622BE4D|nr:hypothetical protein [uncultured Ruegeria sp.]